MPLGLAMSRFVNVDISLTPEGAVLENFQSLLLIDDGNVIDAQQRIRAYNGILDIAGDFPSTDGVYKAATLYYSQQPEPTQNYVGRWVRTTTAGILVCGPLTTADKTNWTSVLNGGFDVTIGSSAGTFTEQVSLMNFSATGNDLNAVAAVIQAALIDAVGRTGITCIYNGTNFVINNGDLSGPQSTIGFLTPPTGPSPTDISLKMQGRSNQGGYTVPGYNAETALAAVIALDQLATQWYALEFATGTENAVVADSDYLAVAGYIEASGAGSGNPHIFGVSTAELPNGDGTDIGSILMADAYERTFVQYSTDSNAGPFAVASIFGRLLTVDFTAINSTIDIMWKQEPGVLPENLSTTNADNLDTSRLNYYAVVQGGPPIIVNGTMAGPAYIDEIFGMDAFANRIQIDLFNLFFTTPNKIPQTDSGVHMEVVTVQSSCNAFVRNGFLAPGVWQSTGFGTLQPGDTLSNGYYVYAPPVALQDIADRAARKSPTIQVAAKEAGAINTVDCIVLVNR